jgi:hypothetical protein
MQETSNSALNGIAYDTMYYMYILHIVHYIVP